MKSLFLFIRRHYHVLAPNTILPVLSNIIKMVGMREQSLTRLFRARPPFFAYFWRFQITLFGHIRLDNHEMFFWAQIRRCLTEKVPEKWSIFESKNTTITGKVKSWKGALEFKCNESSSNWSGHCFVWQLISGRFFRDARNTDKPQPFTCLPRPVSNDILSSWKTICR